MQWSLPLPKPIASATARNPLVLQTGAVVNRQATTDMGPAILCVLLSCAGVYGALFGVGYWLKANYLAATVAFVVATLASAVCCRIWLNQIHRSEGG